MTAREFDHRAAGTPESVWRAADLHRIPAIEPSGCARVLAVSAHPDDETLGAGGVVAMAARSGLPVHLIVASDGENSHPQSPTHSPGALATIRRDEMRQALADLAPSATITFLGLPDGALSDLRWELHNALADLADGSTLLVTPWIGDGHPDHWAVGECGTLVAGATGATLWQYPIWAWHWADPTTLPIGALRRVELTAAARALKSQALSRHVSQHRPLSDRPGDEPILAESFLEHFRRDFEIVVVAQ